MSDCDRIKSLLVEYVDGELPPDENAIVAEHVGTCDECRQTVHALKESLNLTRVVWNSYESELNAVRTLSVQRAHSRSRRPLLVAASIALLFASVASWHFLPRSADTRSSDPQTPTFAEVKSVVNRAGV